MKIAAVLLAGGESRRLGQDKASLSWNGCPLWQHQLETLRKIRPAEIFVSARSVPAWQPPDVALVKDPEPARGPLGGLFSALSAMNGSHLLILAVDMPAMTANYLQSLIEKCAPGCGACSHLGGRAEPLAAIYPAEALPIVEATYQSGTDVSLRSLVRKLLKCGLMVAVEADEGERELFRNINRPEDLAAPYQAS